MRKAIKLFIAILLLTITLIVLIPASGQTTAIDNSDVAISTAYSAILNASNTGASTNQLIRQLNQAINLTAQAESIVSTDPQQAQTLATQAQAIAQNVTQQATAAQQTSVNVLPIVPVVVAVLLVVAGVVVYLLGPKAIWRLWFRLRKNYKVKLGAQINKKRDFFLTAEQLCAVVLAAAIIVAFVSVSGLVLPKTQEDQFSELGILGPTLQVSDYPSQVVASDSVQLYGYVGNNMGIPMYYTVMVKLGDNQTQIDPAPVTPIQQYSQVLANNQTWTFPVNVTLTHAGVNQRIIFELWIYNQTLNQNQYDGRWGQVWLNVTAPAT